MSQNLIYKTPDFNNAFSPTAYKVSEFFERGKVGFYIPLYQREYSWNTENVEQLLSDICNGVLSLCSDDNAVKFLGTVILCQETDKQKNIQPIDIRALPTTIFNVIDGQQRISTIALLATRLYRRIFVLRNLLDSDAYYNELVILLDDKLELIEQLFSLDMGGRAKPRNKPVVIRGSDDEWTLDGPDEKYISPVASYLAKFIREKDSGGVDIPDRRTRLGKNLKEMDSWLDIVFSSHENSEGASDLYPSAEHIFKTISQELIWEYDREEYFRDYFDENFEGKKKQYLAEVVQSMIFVHYFLDRSCFTVIEPTSENWAFDMFQSLNATGTPLTAIETFKPLVVNHVNNAKHSSGFKGSKIESYFNDVDELFVNINTASQKTKLTNEYLNVLKLMLEGKSLSNQFSEQRKWLNDTYLTTFKSDSAKDKFIQHMSELSLYWKHVLNFNSNNNNYFYGLGKLTKEERELTVLSVKYLNDSSHRMSNTILSRLYSKVLREDEDADKVFAEASKAIAAFFTLWRATSSNSGLDDVYRKLLNPNREKLEGVPNFSLTEDSTVNLDIDELKAYLISCLERKGIWDENTWIEKAKSNLRYDFAKTVCRFALFVTSHDSDVDNDDVGLMKKAATGYSPYLGIEQWYGSDLKTLEHIAPQNPELGWSDDIYKTDSQESIGNLTLLPTKINSSAGNRSWKEKSYYYRHLSLSDVSRRDELYKEAQNEGINLSKETIGILCDANYAGHIKPIVKVIESNIDWEKSMIDKRSTRICSLLWDEMVSWLS